MNIAGLTLRREHVRVLIGLLDPKEPLAQKLNLALNQRSQIVALTIQDRVRLLAALEDPPGQLATLHQRLLEQFRRRDERAAREQQQRNRDL